MNLDGTPSRAEVTDWSCQTLADYLKKMRLSGCDTLVKRSGINGSKFLAMSDTDIQRFPKVHVPLIIKIRNEINQAEKKKGLFHRPKSTPHPKQGFVPTPETWPTDEFDDEDSEPDYEEPDDPNETFEDNYICAEEVYHETVESDDEYELPPSEISTEIPRHCHTARPVGDGVYIGRIRDVPAKSQTPKPPQRPDSTQSYPSKSQASSLAAKSPKPDSPRRPVPSSCKSKPVSGPRIDRRTKPHSAAQKDTANLQMASGLPNFPTSRSTQLVSNDQDMDPEWYVRSMTRGEAENYLRQINKNGAFLVRDSSINGVTPACVQNGAFLIRDSSINGVTPACVQNGAFLVRDSSINGVTPACVQNGAFLIRDSSINSVTLACVQNGAFLVRDSSINGVTPACVQNGAFLVRDSSINGVTPACVQN
ncbi:uncharacterized protein lcp2b isoform X2 [Brachyhypopomus gauderio]|uniref:uncharacterized protein lcp2b isoform X2 n=1 Tax=Brachyhypopomus gauderio TaxID=698409 RepID=UPI00404257AB